MSEKFHAIEYKGYLFKMSPYISNINRTISIKIDLIIDMKVVDSRFEPANDINPFNDVAWGEFITGLNHKLIYDTDEFEYLLELFKLN